VPHTLLVRALSSVLHARFGDALRRGHPPFDYDVAAVAHMGQLSEIRRPLRIRSYRRTVGEERTHWRSRSSGVDITGSTSRREPIAPETIVNLLLFARPSTCTARWTARGQRILARSSSGLVGYASTIGRRSFTIPRDRNAADLRGSRSASIPVFVAMVEASVRDARDELR
jgi:hypothetical protein